MNIHLIISAPNREEGINRLTYALISTLRNNKDCNDAELAALLLYIRDNLQLASQETIDQNINKIAVQKEDFVWEVKCENLHY